MSISSSHITDFKFCIKEYVTIISWKAFQWDAGTLNFKVWGNYCFICTSPVLLQVPLCGRGSKFLNFILKLARFFWPPILSLANCSRTLSSLKIRTLENFVMNGFNKYVLYNDFCRAHMHRFIENVRLLWRSLDQFSAQTMANLKVRSSCSGPCSIQFWRHPKMDINNHNLY